MMLSSKISNIPAVGKKKPAVPTKSLSSVFLQKLGGILESYEMNEWFYVILC